MDKKAEMVFENFFDPEDATCFAVKPNGTAVFSVFGKAHPDGVVYFSKNPLLFNEDLAPTESYHRPDKGRRAEPNVTKARNIIIEDDSTAKSDFLNRIHAIELPYSNIIDSGGKSLHVSICLTIPCLDPNDYKSLVERVYRAVSGPDAKPDPLVKSMSGLTRYPGALRLEKGTCQTVLEVKERVDRDVLEAWLKQRGHGPETYHVPREADLNLEAMEGRALKGILPKAAKYFISFGASEGSRRGTCFKVACMLCEAGYSLEEARRKLAHAGRSCIDGRSVTQENWDRQLVCGYKHVLAKHSARKPELKTNLR